MSVALTKKTFIVSVSCTIYCVMKMILSSHSNVMRQIPPRPTHPLSYEAQYLYTVQPTETKHNLLSTAASDIWRAEQDLNCNGLI